MTQILTELTAAYFTSSFSNIISGTFFNLLEVTGIKAETSCHYFIKKKRLLHCYVYVSSKRFKQVVNKKKDVAKYPTSAKRGTSYLY